MIASAGTFAHSLRAGVSRSLAGATTSASADDRAPARKSLSRRAGRVPAPFFAVLFLCAFTATSAQASTSHIFDHSFGALQQPAAIAVDQESHDVYVADLLAGTLSKFDASGAPSDFSSTPGSNQIGGFGFNLEGGTTQIAVSPVNHDIYVAPGLTNHPLLAFNPSGEPAEFSSLGANEIQGREICGVAVDASGDLYVGDYGVNRVNVYTASGELLTGFTSEHACNLAVDSVGTVYVDPFPAEDPHGVLKYSPSDFPVTPATEYESGEVVDTSRDYGVAVDPSNDDLYVDQRTQVVQFNQAGTQISTFANAGPGAVSASEGLAVEASSGSVYVSDAGAAPTVDLFTPPPPLPPSIDSTFAANVSSTSGDLEGQVNPHAFDTHYHFEYIGAVAYEANVSSQSDPFTGALSAPETGQDDFDLGAASVDRLASVHLQGLLPETTYYYRLVADNGNGGTQFGPARSFTTQASPPSGLPDNRAWEMVSPIDKSGVGVSTTVLSGGGVLQAAPDGSAITYPALGSFGANPKGSPAASQYLSRRAQGAGWSTQNITTPLTSGSFPNTGYGTPYYAFSTDLSRGLVIGPTTTFPGFEAISAPTVEGGVEVVAVTPDLDHVVLNTGVRLAEWSASGGAREFGTHSRLGTGGVRAPHVIADDGGRVFFENEEGLSLYDDHAQTIVEIGSGQFLTASSDGSRSFISRNGDLFEYDAPDSSLTDLAPGADLQGVAGVSTDGSHLYFVANGVLGDGAEHGAQVGDCGPGELDGSHPGGTCNLYLLAEGAITFVATLSGDDDVGVPTSQALGQPGGWVTDLVGLTSRVTAEGDRLAFMSDRSLTGQDTAGTEQVYLYDAGTGRLVCASCNPSGAKSTASSFLPAGTPNFPYHADYQSRALSASGDRIFFNSQDALVPQDTNGRRDVYEWEDNGSGSCRRAEGCIFLLSSGTGDANSTFVDASSDGDDVFFTTASSLLPQDVDTNFDIYDARVGGGVPAEPPASPACEGDACQSPVSVPPEPSIGTLTFPGGEGSVSHHHKPRHRHQHKRHHKRSAKANQGATR